MRLRTILVLSLLASVADVARADVTLSTGLVLRGPFKQGQPCPFTDDHKCLLFTDANNITAAIQGLDARSSQLASQLATLQGQVAALQGGSSCSPFACTNMTPASGPVGTPVTLSGTCLPASVTLNSTTANAQSSGGGTILTFSVPSGATTGMVTVHATDGTSQNCGTFTVTTATSPPVISSFTASPSSITAGSSSTLSWVVNGAATVSISGVGTVTGSSASVTPAATTTYTLTAVNAACTAGVNCPTATATVTVNATAAWATVAVPPWDNDSGAGNMTVAQSGGRAALTETGTGAVYHYLRYQLTTAPTLNQPYILSARVQAGSCTLPWLQIQTYSVRGATCTFNLASGTVYGCDPAGGGTGRITSVGNGEWDVAVTGVFVDPGQATPPPTGLPYFIVIGCGTGAETTSGVAVYARNTVGLVQGAPIPQISSFTASPANINAGQSATLSWATSGTLTGLSIDQGVGPIQAASFASGSVQIQPTTTTTYTITGTNASGQATATATVTVTAAGTVATPVLSIGTGTYTSTQSMTISDATQGAGVCYTTDGSTPTATTPGTCSHGTTYSGAIAISSTTTIIALGTKAGLTNSATASAVITISTGGNTPGTGGSNAPTYLCASGGTCTGHTVTGGGSASDATLIANSYNVRTSGGAAGNCSTDDTATIQAANDTAASQGKALYFPAAASNCYLIHGSLYPTTHWVGAAGVYPEIRMLVTSGTVGDGGHSMLRMQGTNSVIISGLTLDGGLGHFNSTFGAHTVNGFDNSSTEQLWAWDSDVHFFGGSNVTIRNNYIRHAAGDGIEIDPLSDNGYGGSNIIIDNNTIEWNSRQEISIKSVGSPSSAGLVITNNIMDSQWGYGQPFDCEPNSGSNEHVWNVELAYNQTTVANIDPYYRYTTNWDTALWSADGGNIFVHGNSTMPGGTFGTGGTVGGWCANDNGGYNHAWTNVHACVSPGN